MIVTRHPENLEQSHWSFTKFETTPFHKPPASPPRMSNPLDTPFSTQPDWQGQYSYLPPGESSIFSQSFEQSHDNSGADQSRAVAGSGGPLDMKEEPHSPLGHRIDPLGLRPAKQPSPIPEHPEQAGEYGPKAAESVPDESLVSGDTPGLSLASNPLSSVSSAGQGQEIPASHTGNDGEIPKQEDEDEVVDDEEMVEGDGGEATSQPQTAAERTAQRRKMKRFRLTHQQTRFLMSEFAKQPHPDAAHRERLSREIPGLSPRQVQVWFQNRRAKIKRLTADDRDRMIKMRAVPDDFDNVQALHSPYGAVHGLGTPITSPVDFGTPSYAHDMMRPLMVDVRRAEGDDHMSPTGLSPAFGSIGFNPSGTMSNPDILSPLSPTSNDRYGYGSHLSTPLSAGPRTSHPFARQNSLDASMQMHNRQQIRPLQPLQLRETMSRSRSDSLQSPLRSSMSWKGDAIDYSYQGGNASPQMGGRQQSVYQPDQINTTSSGLGYDSNSYSSNAVQSPTGMSYSNLQSPNLQQAPQNRSRLRAASATLPLGLDLRNQYRSVGSALQSPSHNTTPRATAGSQFGGTTNYTASFPSAPLTAPIDFSLPRTPGIRTGVPDYSMPQMSAPIAPPNDFSQAFHASMSSSNARTPMRDTFGGGPLGISGTQNEQRNDDYSQDLGGPNGLKRKRSFPLPGGPSPSTGSGPQAYGNTT